MSRRLYGNTVGNAVFNGCNIFILMAYAVLAVIPFIYIIAGSFATSAELSTRAFFLIPKKLSLAAYQFIFKTDTVSRALLVSVYITVVGTFVNLVFTLPMSYALSKQYLYGRRIVMKGVIFSMLFGGGMIPTYLVVKACGFIDTYFALWLPGAVSAFNMIVIKNFFEQLPLELEESARIDGCTDLQVLLRIVLPLSKPVIATFALFYAVGHWNAFFSALIYINKPQMWPLQVILRNMVILSTGMAQDATILDPEFVPPPDQSIKMAVIVIGTAPILMVYPFLQKYFVKGVLLGSIK